MQFEQAGILSRNHFESGKAVFELNEGKHHDHLVCLDCGRVEEFYDAEIEKRQNDRGARARLRAAGSLAGAVRGAAPRRTARTEASSAPSGAASPAAARPLTPA